MLTGAYSVYGHWYLQCLWSLVPTVSMVTDTYSVWSLELCDLDTVTYKAQKHFVSFVSLATLTDQGGSRELVSQWEMNT